MMFYLVLLMSISILALKSEANDPSERVTSVDKDTFEAGFDGWSVERQSWVRIPLKDLQNRFDRLPMPPDLTSKVLHSLLIKPFDFPFCYKYNKDYNELAYKPTRIELNHPTTPVVRH